MCKCKYCGKEFDSGQKLGGHIIRCKDNPNYYRNLINCNNLKPYKRVSIIDIHVCEFCGKECKNKNSYSNHIRFCKKNPNHKESPLITHSSKSKSAWNKGLTSLTDERILKQSNSLKEFYKTHSSPNKGNQMCDEQKEKIRISTVLYLKNTNNQFAPRYSKKSIEYIKKLNEVNHWNLQHAENGGEYEVDGYFLDGYDKELNIAFEYDEKKHYSDPVNNILSERDIERQEFIIEKLGCKFYRYNEYLDYFYRIN